MFNDVQGLLQRVTTGEVDGSSVSQAAGDHLASMDQGELTQHLQTAADSATQKGQTSLAQQIMGVLSRNGSNPQGLKQDAVSLIAANPGILEHFAPDFAKGILGRI